MSSNSGLLGPDGNPIKASIFGKDKAPKMGRKFGYWEADNQAIYGHATDPLRNSIAQFDLDSLTITDFAAMKTHPQVNASLSVLSFMQHQSPWKIECDDKKIADFCTEQLTNIWTTLNRCMAQANWAGYSPGVIEWENDVEGKSVQLHKIMDLVPQTATINWKEVKGWAPPNHIPPKFNEYDGIKQIGMAWPIPRENTFWYPLLMENGDYSGRKLLKSAFTPWYFSILIHLYANRYYERFGEPIPVGRAPFEDGEMLTLPDGNVVKPADYMFQQMDGIRNRSKIILPDEGQQDGSGRWRYEYNLEFMESQMRGADFERHLIRLDEEISLSLFTPVLLMKTADVGSYNLGQGHMQVYLWMMNAMNADRKMYIDKYLLAPLVNMNFGKEKPRAKIIFRQLGSQDTDMLKAIVQGMFNRGTLSTNVEELGEIIGLSLEEVEQTIKTPEQQADEEDGTSEEEKKKKAEESKETVKKVAASKNPKFTSATDGDPDYWKQNAVIGRINDRVREQIISVYRNEKWETDISVGFEKQLTGAFRDAGTADPATLATTILACAAEWSRVVLRQRIYKTPDDYMEAFASYLIALTSRGEENATQANHSGSSV